LKGYWAAGNASPDVQGLERLLGGQIASFWCCTGFQ
jgi:hypothetical protein